MELRLDDRVALVTGGSLGLGRAIAEAYCAAGARVAILARGEAALTSARTEIERATGAEIRAYVCDLGDPRRGDVLGSSNDTSRALPGSG